MDKGTAIKLAKSYISFLKGNGYDIRKAYLFGTYAKGGYREESDIDIAVVLDRVPNSFLMQIELMKLRRDFDSRIEPHPFDVEDFDSTNPFAHEIMTTGIQVL